MSAEVDALRTAIEADLSMIEPEIRGLMSMSNDSLPQSAISAIGDRLTRLQRRQGVDQAALDALAALDQDSFPTIPDSAVPADVLAAINGDKSDVEAAAGGFIAQSMATTGTVTFPAPTPKEP